MQLPLTRAIVPSFELLDEAGSTNTELVTRASAGAQAGAVNPLPHFTVLATTNQTAGRGRLGRTWVAPPGTTIAVSVLIAPGVTLDRLGWMPLLAGVAMCRAVRALLPTSAGDAERVVGLKWPNDVQVRGAKVCGILAEVVPGATSAASSAIVVGAGLNLTMTTDQLPVPTATSLTLEGADPIDLVDRALAAYLGALRELVDAHVAAAFDADSGLRAAVLAECTTIGAQVRVERPEGELRGRAIDIDSTGRLVVDTGAATVAVAAGDVTHVRPAG
jgi:BirA family biotin operon repressor/biotin-[acetyl-CoA-carboxylase] ligase